jgi:two-component system nitrate/nitrite response regulator NarL
MADLIIVKDSVSAEHTVEAVRQLKETYPAARIAVIADNYDLSFVRLCLSAGVSGFCEMGSSREVLIKSFELVMLGELILPTALMASLLNGAESVVTPKPLGTRVDLMVNTEDQRGKKLSAREAEILGHLMEGAANKVIARKLDVAEATIKVHIKSILRKVGAANRTQAAMWASTSLPTSNAVPLSG